jgi:hypothetical protein
MAELFFKFGATGHRKNFFSAAWGLDAKIHVTL